MNGWHSGVIPKVIATIRRDIELIEMQRAHAYTRRDELLDKNIAPRLENLRGNFVTRLDHDIWTYNIQLDELNAQIAARYAE
jgi:hypothetical protein